MRLNLLVPEPFSHSSYYLVQGLRAASDKIVISLPKRRFAQLYSITARSRLVDKLYYTTDPTNGWQHNVYAKDSTATEEIYLKEIIDICRKEKINLIYPCADPLIIFFSKHKNFFLNMGIQLPVLEYPKLFKIMDKFSLFVTAKRLGVPVADTSLIENEDQLREWCARHKFPLFVKPRFGFAAFGACKFKSLDELLLHYKKLKLEHGGLIVQEFIPGNDLMYLNVYFDKRSDCISELTAYWRSIRPEVKVFQNMGIAIESMKPRKDLDPVISLLKEEGYVGLANVQFKFDSKERVPKLMDIGVKVTPHAWIPMKFGLNQPFTIYKIFNDEKLTDLNYRPPEDTVFLYPFEDAIIFMLYCWCLLVKWCYRVLFRRLQNPFTDLPPLRELLTDYKKKYFYQNKVWDFMLTNFFKEPLVVLTYWASNLHRIFFKEFPNSFKS